MNVKRINDINREILCSKDDKQLVIGSREQSKTDIIVMDALQKNQENPTFLNKTLFLVTETSQIQKLRSKFKNQGYGEYQDLEIKTYLDFFYNVYKNLLSNLEVQKRLMNFSNSKDKEKIIDEMEIILVQRDMFFEEFPPPLLWKEFVNFTYNPALGSLLDASYTSKKISMFCKEMLMAFTNESFLTKHLLVREVINLTRDDSRHKGLKQHLSKFRNLYCDDIHFLTEKWSFALYKILSIVNKNTLATADRFHTPNYIFEVDKSRRGISFFLQDDSYIKKLLIHELTLTEKQKAVYSALMHVLSPLVPINRSVENLGDTNVKLDEVFQLTTSNEEGLTFPTEILKTVMQHKLDKKSISIYHNDLKFSTSLEALLLLNKVNFYTNSKYSFWTNSHNAFIASYINFFSDKCSIDDLSIFFSRLIPRFSKFEFEALEFISEARRTNYENVDFRKLVPEMNTVSKNMFMEIFSDLVNIRKSIKTNWEKNSYLIFVNKWIRRYVGGYDGKYNNSSPNYMQIVRGISINTKIKSIFDLCNLIADLEDREFYNPKEGILISDSDSFKYQKDDIIMLFNNSRATSSSLSDQSSQTLNLIYEMAASFNDKLLVYVSDLSTNKSDDKL